MVRLDPWFSLTNRTKSFLKKPLYAAKRRDDEDDEMINKTESDERAHFDAILTKLNRRLATLEARVRRYADEVKAQKAYLWESRSDMDRAEKVSTREIADQILTGSST